MPLLPAPIYVIAPIAAEKVQFRLPTGRTIPYRNDYTWFLRPWRTGYRGPERFADEALKSVEENAVIYADGTTVYSLLYAQELKGLRRNVTIVSEHGSVNNLKEYDEDIIDELLSKRAIYVVSPVDGYCPAFLLKRFDFVKAGVLYLAHNCR